MKCCLYFDFNLQITGWPVLILRNALWMLSSSRYVLGMVSSTVLSKEFFSHVHLNTELVLVLNKFVKLSTKGACLML